MDSCLTSSHLHQRWIRPWCLTCSVCDCLCFDACRFISKPSTHQEPQCWEPCANITRFSFHHTRLLFKQFWRKPACQVWFCGRTYLKDKAMLWPTRRPMTPQWIIHSPALQDMPGHWCSQQEQSFIHYQALVCCLQRFPLPLFIAPSSFNKTSHSFKLPLGSRGLPSPSFFFQCKRSHNGWKAGAVINCRS